MIQILSWVITSEIVEHPDFIQDAGVPIASETHGGEDVGIFARGPMAHLFQGTKKTVNLPVKWMILYVGYLNLCKMEVFLRGHP